MEGLPRRRTSLSRLVSWSTATLLVVPGALIVLLALVILVYENANATKGYRLRTLERERKQLLLQQETINMQIAQAQALQHLVADPQILGMEVVTRPTFIAPLPAVAELPLR